ncbi:hypothetical protein D3C86_2138500 [compost metagenome]
MPKDEIAGNDYDLSISRYKQVMHEVIEYETPAKIIADLKVLEAEIAKGTAELAGLVG